jgi:benzoyl-CoA 2,3-dioxygenase component B
LVAEDEFEAKKGEWLPTSDDQAYIESLMEPQLEPGKFAGWIAPPARGIQGKPTDFEYVKLP